MTRVLAFICSRHRPVFLRHVVLQMMVQTYPVDLAIYINGSEQASSESTTDYSDLISDLVDTGDHRIKVSFGPSSLHHWNYQQALAMVDINNYDLFLKLDDDDIYRRSYVEDIVRDFEAHQWDMSGQHSVGGLNGIRWKPHHIQKNLGLGSDEVCAGMASSWGFSRRAIKKIITLEPNPSWFEDRLWKHHLGKTPGMKLHCRGDNLKNYHYNIHGENASTASWLEASTQAAEQPQVLTSFQAVRTSAHLLRQALPLLPGDTYRKIKNRLRS